MQNFLQDVIDNSLTVIFAKQPDGRYLFINKSFEKLYKVSKEKVINMTDYEIFPKEFADSFVAKDKIIIETGKSLSYEEDIPSDDGLRTYTIVKFPLHDDEGKLYAVCGMATDITQRKNAEVALRTSENRFNFVLAATQDAIYDWDFESGRIWRNEQYEKLFDGPSGPDFEWWRTHIHPDEFEDVVARLEDTFKKQEQLWHQEYRFKRANDEYAYIIDRGFILYNKDRKPVRMIGAFMDITERKQFIDDLEESLALLRATLESTTNGILVVNLNNKIVEYNKRFVEMWNLPNSIIEAKEDRQTIAFVLVQLKDPDKFVSRIEELYAAPEEESFDIIELLDNRVFERYSKPQKTKTKIIGRVWSFQDITQRRKIQEVEKIKSAQMLFRQQELLKLTKLKSDQPIAEKYKIILESDAKTLDIERVSICFFDEKINVLKSENVYSLSKNIFISGILFLRKDAPRFFQELEEGRLIDANDAKQDPRTSELNENYLIANEITSILSIPIRLSGKVVGIVQHEHVGLKRIWTYGEQAFAYSIADIIILALENEDKERAELEIKNLNNKLERFVKDRTSELEISKHLFYNLVDNIKEYCIIMLDIEGSIMTWNQGAQRIYGYMANEIIGKHFSVFYTEEEIKKGEPQYNLKMAKENGHIENTGWRVRKNGSKFWTNAITTTFYEGDGNLKGFTKITRDITEPKQNENVSGQEPTVIN